MKSVTPIIKNDYGISPRLEDKFLYSETPNIGSIKSFRKIETDFTRKSKSPAILKTECSVEREKDKSSSRSPENMGINKIFGIKSPKFNQFEFSNFFKNKVPNKNTLIPFNTINTRNSKEINTKINLRETGMIFKENKDINMVKSKINVNLTQNSSKNFNLKFKDFLADKKKFDRKII